MLSSSIRDPRGSSRRRGIEVLRPDPRKSCPAPLPIDCLFQLAFSRDKMRQIDSSGPSIDRAEYSSHALEAWVMSHDVQLCFIRPGRPVENGLIESFNGRLRDECLNVEWFVSLLDARQKLAKFRQHCNHERPHSALADRTPAAFAEVHRSVTGKASTSMECAKPA